MCILPQLASTFVPRFAQSNNTEAGNMFASDVCEVFFVRMALVCHFYVFIQNISGI